jgi:hypothetical protein
MSEMVTGADDWRSDEQKEKAELRKGAMSLLKTWIPEHPEAAAERDVCYGLIKNSFGTRSHITFLSLLSTGVEDLWAIEYQDTPVSLQELLVQREGTEAFLDPRNALRVVRRKYGMMTLINRITGTFEHRNILAITLDAAVEEAELLKFCRVMGERISDSTAEEEIKFKKAFDRGGFPHIDIVYHADEVGRRIPVPWEVKLFYARLARAMRRRGADPVIAGRQFTQQYGTKFKPKALRQLLLYAKDMKEALEAPPELDVVGIILQQYEETPLLTVTRSLFDEYQILRREMDRERALGGGLSDVFAEEAPPAPGEADADADFMAEAEGAAEGDQGDEEPEIVRIARALDLVRRTRGREFFARISMVGGDIDFLESAQRGVGFEDVEKNLASMDPLEGLREARKIPEAFYRARALAKATRTLVQAGREDDARAAAREALAAARACKSADVGQAYAVALEALLVARDEAEAGVALQESLAQAHSIREADQRAAALMRAVSTLMEAGPLPAAVRQSLSRHILGEDVHFWGRNEIEPPLVEAIVSLLPGLDSDTLLFLQKVSAHPEAKVRRSVVRTMPFDDTEDLRRILLAHLKDKDGDVRVEVLERIGWNGDRKLGVYLVNHLRNTPAAQMTPEEKRALALNLMRIDPERYLPMINAMLGSLATHEPTLVERFKPVKDDQGLQIAALEVLYHLNGRLARKLLYNASQQSKGALRDLADRIWGVVKAQPYGDPKLPRSPHDPDWTEADAFDLLQVLDQVAPLKEELPPEETAEDKAAERQERSSRFDKPKGGLLSRLRARLFKKGEESEDEALDESAPELAADGGAPGVEVPQATVAAAPAAPKGPPPAALRFEAVLLEGPEIWSGAVTMTFALYTAEGANDPVWTETVDRVSVEKGAFEVQLGLRERLPTPLPNVVWLGIEVERGGELRPRMRLSRARSVVQG